MRTGASPVCQIYEFFYKILFANTCQTDKRSNNSFEIMKPVFISNTKELLQNTNFLSIFYPQYISISLWSSIGIFQFKYTLLECASHYRAHFCQIACAETCAGTTSMCKKTVEIAKIWTKFIYQTIVEDWFSLMLFYSAVKRSFFYEWNSIPYPLFNISKTNDSWEYLIRLKKNIGVGNNDLWLICCFI